MQKPNLLRDSLQKQIREETEKLDMELELGDLQFSPWNTISCRDLELRSKLTPDCTLAIIDKLQIQIVPLSLLSGNPKLQKLQLKGVTIICPALHSPTGSDEPVLKDLSCSFGMRNKQFSLEDLSFRLHNTTVSCSLKGGPPLKLPKSTKKTDEKPVLQTINEVLATLYKLKPQLAKLVSPTLHLTARKNGNIEAGLTAYGLQVPEIFQCGKIHIVTQFKPDLENIQFATPLIAKLDNILFRKQFRAAKVHVNYQIPDMLGTDAPIFPIKAKVSTTEILYEGEPVGRFIGNIKMETLNELNLLGTMGLKNSFLALDSRIRLDKKSAQVKSHIKLHQNDLHHLMAFIPRKYLEYVQFRNPIEGSLEAILSEGWKPVKANFSLSTGQLVAADVPIAKLQTKGSYVPGRLDVESFNVHLKPGLVKGSLKQDLKTLDYRLLLRGEFFPSQINPWMQDWWDELWGRFKFTGLPVNANFSLEGRWNDLTRRDIFGDAVIHSASYKGVPFDRVRGQLLGIPKYTKLFGLQAEFRKGQGHARGELSWVFHPTERDRLSSQRFSLQGKLLPSTAGKLFGKEVRDAVKDFDLKIPATIESSGVFYGKKPPEHIGDNVQDAYAISCKAEELTYHKIPLRKLDMFLHGKGNQITINPLKFEFANGKAEGWLKHLHRAPDNKPLEISLRVHDANKNTSLRHLAKSPNFADKITLPSKDSSEKAIFETFVVKAKGDPTDITSFVGKGMFDLFDPELAKVNMLSLLSKELTGLTLPLISYRFNRMKSDFLLKDKRLVITDKPLLITGPAAKVEATGDIHLKTQDLRFRVKLHPLGLPLANILEMRLGGKLNDPKWNPPSGPVNKRSGKKTN